MSHKLIKLRKKSKRSVYSFFLFSYTMVLLIALSSCLFFGAEIARQLRKDEILNKQAQLATVQSSLEENLQYVEEVGNSLVFKTKLQLFVKHPSVASASDAMGELAGLGIRRDFLLDYFLYVRETDEVLTSTIRMSADDFFDIIYAFSDVSTEALRDGDLSEYHFQDFLSTYRVHQYGSKEETYIIPYLQSIPISRTKPSGQVILLLDRDKLFAPALALHGATGCPVYVLDRENTPVYASPDAPSLPAAVLASNEAFLTVDRISFTRYVSDSTGWTYLITTPANLYFMSNRTTVLFLVGVFLAYLLLGAFLVRRIAIRSYEPVKAIHDLIDQSDLDGTKQNEFEQIKSSLLSQMRSSDEMKRVLERQRPSVIRDLFMQLLLGQTQDWELAQAQLRSLDINFGGNSFLVVLVEVSLNSAFFLNSDVSEENDLSIARLVLQNVGCELFSQYAVCHQLEFGRLQSAFLLSLNGAQEERVLKDIAEQAGTLAEFCDKQFELDIFTGISSAKDGLSNLSLCYDEARKALEYSHLQIGGGLTPVLYGTLHTAQSDYYYPPEAEQQLLQAIRTGDSDGAQKSLDRIFTVNFETKHIRTAATRGLFYQLAATLQRLANSEALVQNSSAVLDDHMMDQMVNSPSVDYAHRCMQEIVAQLAASHSNQVRSKTEELADRIAAYIDSSAESDSPTLVDLSDEFGVTPQYISNAFKKARNENIKDYIAKRKLDQAKLLLTTTDLPVKEIAARLGYANEIGIIRLFRKYEDATPGEYRSLHKVLSE